MERRTRTRGKGRGGEENGEEVEREDVKKIQLHGMGIERTSEKEEIVSKRGG